MTFCFRLNKLLENNAAIRIFENKPKDGIEYKAIKKLSKHLTKEKKLESKDFKKTLVDLTSKKYKDNYGVLHINLLDVCKTCELSYAEYFEILENNFDEITKLTLGDIVELDGAKFLKFTLYHHHVLYSGKNLIRQRSVSDFYNFCQNYC